MQVARKLVTEEEFLSLPVSMDKIELIDGEVVLSPSPTFKHQKVLRRIIVELTKWADTRAEPVSIGQSPLDVRFAPGRILQPDAFVILAEVPDDLSGPVTRIPEICIEVLSQDRVHDRVTKRLLYSMAGVEEYWVIEQSGLIERRTGVGLDSSEELRDFLESPLLPGFRLDIQKIFRP